MNRRRFLKNTATLGIVPLLGSGLPIKSLAASTPLLPNPCDVTDRSVVIVYLNGGNDIFNTTVPLDQLSEYNEARPSLALPQASLITLDGGLPSNQQIGLHPTLTSFKDLYDGGKLAVVQGVGYPDVNRSHFKSLENWQLGSGGDEKYNTGWLGRFFNDRYPSYGGLPFQNEPDPLAMVFGRMDNTGFHSLSEHTYEINMSGKDENAFYSIISSLTGEPIPTIPSSDHGSMLQFLENLAASLNVYAGRVQQVFSAGANSGVTYPDSDFGNQLKTVARMLSGGSRTKIFAVTIGGFDTHVNQVDSADTTQGSHAGLLNDTFASLKIFQDDLAALGLEDNVLTVVFSEFGRKLIQNGGYGCDHGSLSSMFVIGNGVEPGVVGNNMNLNNLSGGAPSNVELQHNYHQVYATLLQDWLGADNNSLDNAIFNNAAIPYSSQKVNIINAANIVPAACYFTPTPAQVCACMQVRIWLEGFYDTVSGNMTTDLANALSFPSSQPYNTAPFNYNGTENFATLPTDTVDWLLLELRDANDLSNVIARQAVLLRKDGFMMQPDGTPGVSFDGVLEDDYHLAVFHRNHLAVLSSQIIKLDTANYIYDFTIGDWMAMGRKQQKQINDVFALYAGEMTGNHIIDNDDFNLHQLNQGPDVGYAPADLNGDGNADAGDYDLWFGNRHKLGKLR